MNFLFYQIKIKARQTLGAHGEISENVLTLKGLINIHILKLKYQSELWHEYVNKVYMCRNAFNICMKTE